MLNSALRRIPINTRNAPVCCYLEPSITSITVTSQPTLPYSPSPLATTLLLLRSPLQTWKRCRPHPLHLSREILQPANPTFISLSNGALASQLHRKILKQS